MKMKLTKAISVLMCIVVVCMSISVSSFAAPKDVYTIDKLEGHTVTDVRVNNSETCAVVTLDYADFASTTNGRDYKFFNYYEYLPDYCDEIDVYDYIIKDDTFIFLLRAYKLEEVWDYVESEGVSYKEEKLVLKEQFIVTTKDFNSFKKYDLNFSINELYTSLECINDKILYATVNFFEKNGKEYFEALYYTTSDLAKWTEHKSPAVEVTDLYQDVYYTVAGSTLCIELYTLNDEQYFPQKVYLTDDFENYTTTDNGHSKDESHVYYFCPSSVQGKIIRIGDVYSNDDDSYLRTDIVQIDSKTGEEQVLFSECLNFWESYYTDNEFLFLFEREEGDPAEVFMYNTRAKKFETEKADYSIMDVLVNGYLNNTNDAVLFFKADSLCVSPSGNPAHYNEYDISHIGLDLEETYPFIIKLNGEVLIIATSFEVYVDKTKVAKLDVSLQKNGDLNNDGTVNSTDALQVLLSTVDKTTLTTQQKAVADANKDNAINSTDALMILRYSVGKILGI
ncbi:MAG: dockerin type I repeat-containing protein [Clostridia bacterium]|nr:dockerin type I repeat-containing protein [Clostridia bacterium]